MKEPFTRFFGLSEKITEQMKDISVAEISVSPYQPRTIFEDERLDELCQTIQQHGVIQPIVVRRKQKGYEIIAGERRWRAVLRLGHPTIPAIIKDMSDHQAASASLIENLQRENLTVIEEARAYQNLIEIQSLTQEELAQKLGKGQSTIANKIRLLQLPTEVQNELLKRTITERHARALLTLKDETLILSMLEEIIQKELNVKQSEEKIKKLMEINEIEQKQLRRKSYTRDLRLAVNTIRQSIDLVKQTGMEISTEEKEHDDFYEVVIRIPKQPVHA
ncbi:chromosome partitioning protein, ParB family [Thermoactinomyces sp. DSM 45891]|uniref:nucleoid occlusion protein n=1 Tax=Thermoactinomyces sp. DSM 45891 TaxID=1761907 RepID=UPI00091B5061|nr:nucleoid occlusion protein [Thermoactinomyces sp. DSM 45891]SFX30974.1 chromosome partitioning protein, ParB family [Thermoactinomyces sp. DSM 45891]